MANLKAVILCAGSSFTLLKIVFILIFNLNTIKLNTNTINWRNNMNSFIDKVKLNSNITTRGQDYIDGFINAFVNLDKEYIDRKVLSLQKSSQESQFLQGLAETMLYKFFNAQGLTPSTDIKVNDTEKDVDFVLETNGNRINIEVKCPVIKEKKSDTLSCSTGHRLSNDKKEHDAIFNPVIEKLKKSFEENPNKTYNNFECEKLDDNKLKDYFESAQSKFSIPKSSECNALVLALTTKDFIRFFDYIVNSQTGLFSGNSFVDPSSFDKVDCIILTNVMAGHYKYKLDIDIWDMKKYLTFVIPNLNKNRNCRLIVPNSSERIILQLFGNQLYNFKEFEEEFYKMNPDLPRLIQLVLTSYLARDFELFSQEYKGENLTLLGC